jgi:hypothetical protein
MRRIRTCQTPPLSLSASKIRVKVQKLQLLLDEVHRLIEKRVGTFLLTGSSARRLKRENANMLGGRAWERSPISASLSRVG